MDSSFQGAAYGASGDRRCTARADRSWKLNICCHLDDAENELVPPLFVSEPAQALTDICCTARTAVIAMFYVKLSGKLDICVVLDGNVW